MKSLVITKSEQETIFFAEEFIEGALQKASKNKPLVLYLEGELGAGKTQFVKGVAQGLGIEKSITSPTFVLVKRFDISRDSEAHAKNKKYFFHIDAYRMRDATDARQIGLGEIIKNPKAVVAIEWAERIADIASKPYWELKFEYAGERGRKINIKYVK